MLKKILYNKFKILDIDTERLPMTSEEILKVLFDLKNVIMFPYKDELRLLWYSGVELDWLGRATKFQPMAMAGGEVYKIQTLKTCVKYNENVLSNNVGFSKYSYISDDIDNYVLMLSMIDKAIIINSKQIFLPFLAKVNGEPQANALKNMLERILGKEFKNMIIQAKTTDLNNGGLVIETTNIQLFIQQLQDTKKKILDEAFFYLGVSSAQGKLAHQSELEIESYNTSVNLLDLIMFDKINDFVLACNKKFGLNMRLERKY